MKIGIFTYFSGCNFGEQLQAYTSQQFFESLGHDVWIVNYSRDKKGYDYSRYPSAQAIAHKTFAETRLKLTEDLSQEEVWDYISLHQFDAVAFGADAIWNKRDRVNLSVYTAQWLNGLDKQDVFKRKIKVIGLSPAFMGTTYSDLSNKEKSSFKKGILNFTYPNVRDEWTREIVNREIMGSDYIKIINPDPVFLLNELCTDKWEPQRKDIQSKQYYIVSLPPHFDKSTLKWLLKLKKELNRRGHKLVELSLPDGPSGYDAFDYSVPYPIDPLQWFLWLKNARGYIGLRFHAVVSCISAGTPFFSLDIYGSVPRWLNILNRFGFHKLDRCMNKKSKIRNLIEGSGLEDFRMNGVFVNKLNPKRIIDKLETCDINKITAFRDKNVSIFKRNMTEALSD